MPCRKRACKILRGRHTNASLSNCTREPRHFAYTCAPEKKSAITRRNRKILMLKLHVLASGSKGNAAIVENAATGAVCAIDCQGICKRDFLERCDEAGFDPTRLEAVFITHEHGGPHQRPGRGAARSGETRLRANGIRESCLRRPTARRYRRLRAISGAAWRGHLRFPKTKMRARAAIRLPSAMSASCAPPAYACSPFATSHDAAASFGFSRRVARRRRWDTNRFGHRDERRARGFARRAHFGAREQS